MDEKTSFFAADAVSRANRLENCDRDALMFALMGDDDEAEESEDDV